MRTEARFPGLGPGAGHYESFYIKATRPGGGRAIWIRHTVHKRPDEELTGSIWVTLFDADAPGPRATKVTVGADRVSAPPGAYIKVGRCACSGPATASGEAKTDELEVSWELTLHRRPRGVPPPPLRLPLPGAAAEDEAALALSRTRASAARSRSAASGSSSTPGRG